MIEIASFTTDSEVCPYLHDRPARQRVSIVRRLATAEYAERLASGWRRFGSVLFRPSCGTCAECVPIRVLVRRFRPSKSQRRVLRKNSDVHVDVGEPMVDEERLLLYQRFHEARAVSRGWSFRGIEVDEYVETFLDNVVPTREFRYRLDGKLIGIAYVDDADDAVNSIYAFSDPAHSRRSLGTFDVLTEIIDAGRRGKQYFYLGFFVTACQSMSYKTAFRPHQLLRHGAWRFGE